MKSVRKTKSLVAIAAGMLLASTVMAQSTTGGINGTAKAGTTIVVSNGSGFTRSMAADANGRFSFNTLPIGDYVVEAKGIGTQNVTITIGSATEVSFANLLESVVVTGKRTLIDTTATDTRTVMTAKELSRLPLVPSAQGIALLSPGAVAGSGQYFSNLVSFGGAGVSENAAYVNGYFSGDPLSNLGQMELPYGAIAQQETYTGGYSAKYGRSDGGVINQVGKSGSNAWTFGGKLTFAPNALRSQKPDTYYPVISLPSQYSYANAKLPGTLYRRDSREERSNAIYSAYVGGPVIEDRLFAYVALETSKTTRLLPPAKGTAYDTHDVTKDPKVYAKLNWNITNDHLLEYTYLGEHYDNKGTRYNYNFDTDVEGSLYATVPDPDKRNTTYNILHYTGYLSDQLTLSATYGRSTFARKQINPSILAGVPYIVNSVDQDPAIVGTKPIPNTQGGFQSRDGRDTSTGLRADIEWKLNEANTLSAGIDNIKFSAKNEGTSQVADYWSYGVATENIDAANGVGSPVSASNPNGYYVGQLRQFTSTSMSLDQKAWYVEDKWNLTPHLLLTLGLRNDRFINRNEVGTAYMDAKNQWAPRIGAAWDVYGDSSLKLFGNVGRYFLAMPNSVAIRGASASTYTWNYYTYTGIAADGRPTGLTPVPGVNGGPAPGAVSANGEYGLPVDVQSFAPKDLKNMYQDEMILGFEKALAKGWSGGAKLTYRNLKSSIDDFCDPRTLMTAAGLTLDTTNYQDGVDATVGKFVAKDSNGKSYYVSSCYMFNPGGSNTYTFQAVDGSARLNKKISSTQLGFTEGLKRTYSAVDLFVERTFDNAWSLRVDYTYSKLKGNNEGQVKSESGQTDISKTVDWDAWQLMQYANGYLFNDRRHQLKIRGNYQLAQEWMLMGNASILSGNPAACKGYFNPGNIDEGTAAADPVSYGANYHTCFGKVAKPGDVRMPWLTQVDLGVQYRPSALQGKLAFTVNVFNALDQHKVTQYGISSESSPYKVSNAYMRTLSYQTPRYIQFSLSYDY